MKKYFSTFFAFLCLCFIVLCVGAHDISPVVPSTVYGKVIRLHVLANSDSGEDQELKYRVRDGLLDVTGELFCDCRDIGQALKVAQANKQLLEDTAVRILADSGCECDVGVVIGKEMYPEKKYGGLTFPSGEYLSVRVLIGEGMGQNWWCVLFPPLCNAGIEDGGRILRDYGIDEEEAQRLEEEYNGQGIEIFGCRVRLKILELFN